MKQHENNRQTVAPALHWAQNWTTNSHCGDAVVDGVSLDGLKPGVLDHGDEFLFGHFDPAVFDGSNGQAAKTST